MSGLIIAFPGSRSSSACRRATTNRSAQRSRRPPPRLRLQIERITALLEELEGITGHSSEAPSVMLARPSICKAEQMLGLRDVAQSAPPIIEEEGDPHPHVDHEALERLYRFLDRNQ
jgi:hypothetical protein